MWPCRLNCVASLFVLPGSRSPVERYPPTYPADYHELPILGIIGVHVDDLLCGGSGPEWEAAISKLTSSLKFGDKTYSPITYCGVLYLQSPDTHEVLAKQIEYVQPIA